MVIRRNQFVVALTSSLILCAVGVSAAGVTETKSSISKTATPVTAQKTLPKLVPITPGYSVTFTPQQINLEELYQNPSGKSWWNGDPHASFTVTRQNLDATRKYNVVRLLARGRSFIQNINATPDFSVDFPYVPVFDENMTSLACGTTRPAYDAKNPLFTWSASVKSDVQVDARFWDASGEHWELVTTVTVVANASCEAESKPSH